MNTNDRPPGVIVKGDLVSHHDDPFLYGVVLNVISDVEIPSLIEILWADSHLPSRCYSDDLTIVCRVK